MYLFILLLAITHANADRRKLRDCIRPWQAPLMSISTIASPARPLQCIPESSTCPKGRNSACQFSLKTFKYICCQDKVDIEPPVCPKFHDTLLMTCGTENDTACPRGYNCMPSRYDKLVNLCCKQNDALTYPEPETTFKDNKIVPQVLKKAPKFEAELTFGTETLIMGQLFGPEILSALESPPTVSLKDGNESSLYTVILLDSTTKNINWFLVNIPFADGKLILSRGIREVVEYQVPQVTAQPPGFHVLVLAVLEQNLKWDNKELSSVSFEDFDFGSLNSFRSLVGPPTSASFYGYTTEEDDRV
ncbi:unnamed protein product [Auanema sp. JU1783]|nr:unnamed protein product [Auanema sp. JU1783]